MNLSEDELFDHALQLTSSQDRQIFLDTACKDHPSLRDRVWNLLLRHEKAEELQFLQEDRPFIETYFPQQLIQSEKPGAMIGRYKLLEKIGEGGFGVVFLAEQQEPMIRQVAVKIIKLGMDTKEVIARFDAERQALALMDHPNIAKVLDAGAAEMGRPYFVMEYVPGETITKYCDAHHLSLPKRLALIMTVCSAIQHAHQKGIIHRDIKPSNILIKTLNGQAIPKVIDFGIAKALEHKLTRLTLVTHQTQFIGSPGFMSPEQATMGEGRGVDTRSDIYSLGILLYELLVGAPAINPDRLRSAQYHEISRIIKEIVPPKPSACLSKIESTSVNPLRHPITSASLRREIDWIVMKAIEKDPMHRYQTADSFAEDVRRYLNHEPIIARPPSMAYRFSKLLRRNRLAFTTAAFVTLSLALGLGGVILMQFRANQDYRRRLYVAEVSRASLAWQGGQTVEMRTLLDNCPPDLRHWEWKFLHQQGSRWEQTVLLASTNLGNVSVSADASLMVADNNSVISVHELPSGKWLRNLASKNQPHGLVALAPSGDVLALADPEDELITVWNVQTGERVTEIPFGSATCLAWSNDGHQLAFADSHANIHIWNVNHGLQRHAFSAVGNVLTLAFSPDAKTLAVGTEKPNIQLLDPATGSVQRTLQTRGAFFYQLQFSPDGQSLAAGNATRGGYLRDDRVWNLKEGGGSLDLDTGAEADSFSFSADSQRLVIGDKTGMIQIWDLKQRAEVERFSSLRGKVPAIHLLPDNQILAVSLEDISLWKAERSGLVSLKGYPDALRHIAFTPDSRWLIAAGVSPEVFVWDTEKGRLAGTYTNHLKGKPMAMAVSADGRVATAGSDQIVRMWNPASFETQWEISLAPVANPYWIAFSPDNLLLYALSRRDALIVLNVVTGQRLNSIHGLDGVLDGLAVSPDGQLIAICQKVKLSIRRATDLQELWSAEAKPHRSVAFSPDGEWLATGDRDGAVTLWETASAGKVRLRLRGHTASVTGLSFLVDGSRLASSSIDGRVKIWDWRAGVDLLTLTSPGSGSLWQVVFSPDGKAIATAGGDGIVSLWRLKK